MAGNDRLVKISTEVKGDQVNTYGDRSIGKLVVNGTPNELHGEIRHLIDLVSRLEKSSKGMHDDLSDVREILESYSPTSQRLPGARLALNRLSDVANNMAGSVLAEELLRSVGKLRPLLGL